MGVRASTLARNSAHLSVSVGLEGTYIVAALLRKRAELESARVVRVVRGESGKDGESVESWESGVYRVYIWKVGQSRVVVHVVLPQCELPVIY